MRHGKGKRFARRGTLTHGVQRMGRCWLISEMGGGLALRFSNSFTRAASITGSGQ